MGKQRKQKSKKPSRGKDAEQKRFTATARRVARGVELEQAFSFDESQLQNEEERRLSNDDMLSLVLHHMRVNGCDTPYAAAKLIEADTGIAPNPKAFYPVFCKALRERRIVYFAPRDRALEMRLHEKYSWLNRWRDNVYVAKTRVAHDVAHQAGHMLKEIVQSEFRGKEVHIGFAGGHTMRSVARTLAEMLSALDANELPEKLVFYTMVAGFDVDDPVSDPVVFGTYFLDVPALRRVEFAVLRAPSTIRTADYDKMRSLPEIEKAFTMARQLNIVVTSGGCFGDEHSLFHSYMRRDEQSLRTLMQERCVGDMMWRPLGPHGPLDDRNLEIRAMTLKDPAELPSFIASGQKVLLVLNPCRKCDTSKGAVLRSVLGYSAPHITHLVVDHRTAADAVSA